SPAKRTQPGTHCGTADRPAVSVVEMKGQTRQLGGLVARFGALGFHPKTQPHALHAQTIHADALQDSRTPPRFGIGKSDVGFALARALLFDGRLPDVIPGDQLTVRLFLEATVAK